LYCKVNGREETWPSGPSIFIAVRAREFLSGGNDIAFGGGCRGHDRRLTFRVVNRGFDANLVAGLHEPAHP